MEKPVHKKARFNMATPDVVKVKSRFAVMGQKVEPELSPQHHSIPTAEENSVEKKIDHYQSKINRLQMQSVEPMRLDKPDTSGLLSDLE